MKSAERFILRMQLPEALEVLHYGLAATGRFYDLYGRTSVFKQYCSCV